MTTLQEKLHLAAQLLRKYERSLDDDESLYIRDLADDLAEFANRQPIGSIHKSHLKPMPEPWCKEILLYSANNPGDYPENRISVYA